MISGIITRVDFNEFGWEMPEEPVEAIPEELHTGRLNYSAFNFAHENYPDLGDEYWEGMAPNLNREELEAAHVRNLRVLFFITQCKRKKYLVGLYGFPEIKTRRRSYLIPGYNEYDKINLRSRKKFIYRLNTPLDFSTIKKARLMSNVLSYNKDWSLLEDSQVLFLMDRIGNLNPNEFRFSQIKLAMLRVMLPDRIVQVRAINAA